MMVGMRQMTHLDGKRMNDYRGRRSFNGQNNVVELKISTTSSHWARLKGLSNHFPSIDK